MRWWFVPVANLVMPYLAVRELWMRSSQVGLRPRTGRLRELLPAGWWLFCVSTAPLLLLADWTAGAHPASLRNRSVVTAIAFLLWHAVAMIISALLAVAVVYVIERSGIPSPGPGD